MKEESRNPGTLALGHGDVHRLVQLLAARVDERIRFDSFTLREKDEALERVRDAMENVVVEDEIIVIRPAVARLHASPRPAA